MSFTLPPVGTNHLLELLSPYAPDDFIAEICPRACTGGRRHDLSAAQLWRTHLLAVLTSTHSLNLVVAQLPEQAAWRRFARLRRALPTARMLHEFRQTVGVSGLRHINQHLVGRLLHRHGVQPHAVALMDATDLPAACGGFKKKFRRLHRGACGAGWSHAQDGAEPLVCRLQETHVAVVAAHDASVGDARAAGQLDHTRQRGRRRPVAAESALVSATSGLVARPRGGGHGLPVGGKQGGRTRGLAMRGDHQTACRHETRAAVCERHARGLSAGSTTGGWEYEPESGQQWFRVPAQPELCVHCWQAAACPGHFGYAAGAHETLLGLLPLASRVAQRLLRQVRPWIEPAQSFEKNQLGLGRMFFNSLRLTWQMSLWADSAVLLRTMAWLDTPTEVALLAGLQARQLELGLPAEK